MNNLKTTVTVSCNLQGKAMPTQAKVVGKLGTKVLRDNGIEVGFDYRTEAGELVVSGANTYTWEQVNALWEVVKPSVPADATFEELINVAFLEAFKIEMADTFGITTNEIEEVA